MRGGILHVERLSCGAAFFHIHGGQFHGFSAFVVELNRYHSPIRHGFAENNALFPGVLSAGVRTAGNDAVWLGYNVRNGVNRPLFQRLVASLEFSLCVAVRIQNMLHIIAGNNHIPAVDLIAQNIGCLPFCIFRHFPQIQLFQLLGSRVFPPISPLVEKFGNTGVKSSNQIPECLSLVPDCRSLNWIVFRRRLHPGGGVLRTLCAHLLHGGITTLPNVCLRSCGFLRGRGGIGAPTHNIHRSADTAHSRTHRRVIQRLAEIESG